MLGEPERVVAEDVLGVAGIAPPTLRLYPIETHIAEKLHAYTMPRPRPNSRVKDLPDLALLASVRPLDGSQAWPLPWLLGLEVRRWLTAWRNPSRAPAATEPEADGAPDDPKMLEAKRISAQLLEKTRDDS